MDSTNAVNSGHPSISNFVSNQRKWDTLGPERLEVGRMFGELPEGLVVAPSPLDCLDLHLLSAL